MTGEAGMSCRLKTGWRRVKFGDVVLQVKNKVDPETSGLHRYIAGEHMDTDDLKLRRWGEIGTDYLGPAFHMRFKPGQVLYGSRRTYLRKVAVADFKGVTANTTFVLEPKDPNVLLPELLPFLMQTERFHDHSIKQSRGSVNPYVNFSDLAWYEFALPPLEEQRQMAKLLRAYSNLSFEMDGFEASLDTLVEAAVLDLLDLWHFDPLRDRSHKWPVTKVEQVCTIASGNGEPIINSSGEALYFKVADFNRNRDHLALQSSESRWFPDENPTVRVFPVGTIIFPKRGATIFQGKVGLLANQAALDPNLMALTPSRRDLLPKFLHWVVKGIGLWRLADTTSVPQLNHKHLKDIRVPMPPLERQKSICSTLDDLVRSSSLARERSDISRRNQLSLINEVLHN
ncbi:restriction endonuclease subunit S [Lamprobacter modestohalophilus]|uniref:restriction endonuclease subunit S n=1 Tax=Lamprobacter modestohalophilus TaxID=1064514 RepID=UPI002ADEAEF7|nr:restriction endonuclease subunit S [Lamprobacter modestohalophilus]MEA1052899.1 restriction endonuclease subunit S [Lamprobacter modestohalophilus]